MRPLITITLVFILTSQNAIYRYLWLEFYGRKFLRNDKKIPSRDQMQDNENSETA